MTDDVVLASVLTCPSCGATTRETMPVDFCLWRKDCEACGAVLRPEPGDCCVFCSFGDVPCPPKQQARSGDPTVCGPAATRGGGSMPQSRHARDDVEQKLSVMERLVTWRASAVGALTPGDQVASVFRTYLLECEPQLLPALQDPNSGVSRLVDILTRPPQRFPS